MAIIYPEGTQSYPAGIIQVRSNIQRSPIYGQNQQNQWQTMFTWNSAMTLKAANSIVWLMGSANTNVTGGSVGHFWRWQYSTNGSTWSWFGQEPSSYGNRVAVHFSMRNNGYQDDILRTPVIFHSNNWAAGTTLHFRLQSYQISGASPLLLNVAGQNDGNNNNNSQRGVTTTMAFELQNP